MAKKKADAEQVEQTTVKGKVLAHFTAGEYTFSPNEVIDFETATAEVLAEAGLIEIVKEG